MAEYIEREALKRRIKNSDMSNREKMAALLVVSDETAADVAPVVHCRDCKHITPVEGGLPLCTLHNIARAYNDFCSDGARMDGE